MGGWTCLRSLDQVEMEAGAHTSDSQPSAATLALCGTQDPYACVHVVGCGCACQCMNSTFPAPSLVTASVCVCRYVCVRACGR